MKRRLLRAILPGGALLITLLAAGTQAKADRVNFRYIGDRWSHTRQAGWHRYWGGPSIGFYFAPAPVYVVAGYSAPSYYSGPDFWYSNPSFGLNINLGGGGYYRGHYYGDHDYRDRDYRDRDHRDRDYREHRTYRERGNRDHR